MNKFLSIVFLHWVEEGGPVKETLISLESIFRYTTVPYELIIVSNGSIKELNDKIRENIIDYLSDSNYNIPISIKHVDLETNVGVSKGFNAGLKEISEDSKYISIYSNDWVCSPRWDELMIEELEKDSKMGFATACTNYGSGSMCDAIENPVRFPKQWIQPDDPKIFEKVEAIAEHTLQARGHVSYNQFVCMGWIMRREVFDDVGLMDEKIYTCNDVSYTLLGKLYGWTSKTVWAAYIQHFYHASFKQINNPETYEYIKPLEAKDYERMRTHSMYKNGNKNM